MTIELNNLPHAAARPGLLKVPRIEPEVCYSKRRGFQTDSFVISHMKAR